MKRLKHALALLDYPLFRYALGFAIGAILPFFIFMSFHPSDTKAIEEFRTLDAATRRTEFANQVEADPIAAWAFLKKASLEGGHTVINTHTLAHLVGNKIYEDYGIEGIRYCGDALIYGCIHGVSESYFAEFGPEHTDDLARACGNIDASDSAEESGCIHGLGHGLASWFPHDTHEALDHCDRFSEYQQVYCYDGVFMEVFGNPDPEDTEAWAACEGLDGKKLLHCAQRRLQWILSEGGNDGYLRGAAICTAAPTSESKDACTRSIGIHASQSTLGDITAIAATCERITGTLAIEQCLLGGAQEALRNHYRDAEAVARRLCDMASREDDPTCQDL